jgi:predicted membrane protein
MSQQSNKRVVTGGIFLVVGSLLLLDNLDIFRFNIPSYFFHWYTFLILLGVFFATVKEKVGVGLTLIIIGGIFLLDEMSYYYYWDIDFRDFANFWPLIFVAIGLSLIFKNRNGSEGSQQKKSFDKGSTSDYVDELSVFSGSEKIITSKEFKGGKMTSIFGGTSLNLVNSDLAQGTNILDVFVLFGGTDIVVPSDMNVKVNVTAIFGGFSDDRKMIAENEDNNGKELVIKGLVLFGGGEVK